MGKLLVEKKEWGVRTRVRSRLLCSNTLNFFSFIFRLVFLPIQYNSLLRQGFALGFLIVLPSFGTRALLYCTRVHLRLSLRSHPMSGSVNLDLCSQR